MQLSRDGKTPLPRVYDPPCRRCPKVPPAVLKAKQAAGGKVSQADALEPEARHHEAVEHYLTCVAVGSFPADEWVERVAVLLRPVLQEYEGRPLNNLAGAVRLLAGKLAR